MPQRNDIIELVPLNIEGRHQLVVSFRRRSVAEDLPPHGIVGMVELEGGTPQWTSWRPNRPFLDFFTRYMQAALTFRPTFFEEDANVVPGESFFIIDQRTSEPGGTVPPHDIIGAYQTDAQGRPLAETFRYNPKHKLVLEGGAFSSLLDDRRLYQAVLAQTDPSFSAKLD